VVVVVDSLEDYYLTFEDEGCDEKKMFTVIGFMDSGEEKVYQQKKIVYYLFFFR